MAYSERINTRLVQLAAVTNPKFNKKPLRDLVGRLQKPRYALSSKEADWLNKNCKFWLGATTGFAAGYKMTDRQRQTLRANLGRIMGTSAGMTASNVSRNVGFDPGNVTPNVESSPSNVSLNVGSATLKAAHALGFATPIVNNVIVNSQNSAYGSGLLPPSGAAPVAGCQTGPCAAGAATAGRTVGSADIDAGSAASGLDSLDVAAATGLLTLGAAATSPTDQSDKATNHPTDRDHYGSKGTGSTAGQAGQGNSATANIDIEHVLRLGAFKTIRMSLWTDRVPLGKGEIYFGSHKVSVHFQSAANGAALLNRIASDPEWEDNAAEMFAAAAPCGAAVSGLYSAGMEPIKNACAVLIFQGEQPVQAILDVAALSNDAKQISLAAQPPNGKGPQFKGSLKLA